MTCAVSAPELYPIRVPLSSRRQNRLTNGSPLDFSMSLPVIMGNCGARWTITVHILKAAAGLTSHIIQECWHVDRCRPPAAHKTTFSAAAGRLFACCSTRNGQHCTVKRGTSASARSCINPRIIPLHICPGERSHDGCTMRHGLRLQLRDAASSHISHPCDAAQMHESCPCQCVDVSAPATALPIYQCLELWRTSSQGVLHGKSSWGLGRRRTHSYQVSAY